jgi:DNA-binding GntR family transcriptional regulator
MEAEQPETGADTRGSRGRSDWAYDMLHEAIREGTIEPGQRLMEVEVSNWLEMSRTPVREALRRLQAEGLLEHAPGGGMAVLVYDLRAIGEFYTARESLEGTTAALAAQVAEETEIRILEATCDAMAKLPPDPRLHARENQTFHEQLQQAAHNRFVVRSLRSLLNFVPLMGRTIYTVPGRIETALAEHIAIVEAIRARDPARAEAAARTHIRRSHDCRVIVVSEDVRSAAQRRSVRSTLPGLPRPTSSS